jgi:hypothetical protein
MLHYIHSRGGSTAAQPRWDPVPRAAAYLPYQAFFLAHELSFSFTQFQQLFDVLVQIRKAAILLGV